MKKILVLLLCLTICVCIVSCGNRSSDDEKKQNTEQTSTSQKDTKHQHNSSQEQSSLWKNAYLEFIERRESDYVFDYRYALIHVDDDNIPELYVIGTNEAEGDSICSYKNGNVIEQKLERMLGGKYIERSGKFLNQNAHMGDYYSDVYTLDKNGFSHILKASYTERYVTSNDKIEIINEYFIDGKSVSKDEYNAAIKDVFDISQAVNFNKKAVSCNSIKKQIAEYK